MGPIPESAEKLFGLSPDDFVRERQELVRSLRDEGRRDEADVVAALRKPPPVVLAANRAAREHRKEAQAAAKAAERVGKTQLGSDSEAYRAALAELDESLDALARAAVAYLSKDGKPPSESTSRRLRDLLRNAVADERARDELARGMLSDETETAGFGAFAGVAPGAARPRKRTPAPDRDRDRKAEEQRRERERKLQDELAHAEEALEDAVRAERQAERERTSAERAVTSLRERLDRLRPAAED